MRDESDVAQAQVFYDLLSAEAATLTAALAADLTRRGLPRSSTESHLLRRELREVQRCLEQLRDRYPEVRGR
ncbi:hypothetical protein [Nocardia sp. XZ_19_385]|uniref:hypothetical protein n=1 Tax=Nocardia sp. XZ_19_385 TaxID=2769488 RepID=UPI00188E7624|nr:hypothetical protein [Nocardia sp. XZ_19_385]